MLRDHINDYIGVRSSVGLRHASKTHGLLTRYLSRDPLGAMSPDALNPRTVAQWVARLASKRLARQTQRNALNALRCMCEWLCETGIIDANPCAGVRVRARPELEDSGRALTLHEQGRLLRVAGPEVAFALYTGLRLSEQWRLEWDDISDGELTVRRSCDGRSPKSHRSRVVPLLPVALASLPPRSAGRVWLYRGRPRTDSRRPCEWRRWCVDAHLDGLRWHDLRHSCATSLLTGAWGRTWSLVEVRALLGHATTRTTERYLHADTELVRHAAREHFGGEDGIRTHVERFCKPLESESHSQSR